MIHTCHVPGCSTPCEPRMLACGACWRTCPSDLQREVYRTVKLRGPHCDASWAPWWKAQAEACAAMARVRHVQTPEVASQIDLWLARELKIATELAAE